MIRRAKVLVVDDEPPIRDLLTRLLAKNGYEVKVASTGTEALQLAAAERPDVVLVDVMLPGETNGVEVCRRLKQDAATRLMPVVIVSALDASEKRVEGLAAGADDFLTKPLDVAELLARVRALVRMKRYTDDLDSASAILSSLAIMIESRDGYGAGHCHRMANYAASVGKKLNVPAEDIRTLYRGAFLHDIGMLAISDSLIRKEGRLSEDEYTRVKAHTTIGDGLCKNLRTLQPIRSIVRSHHERLDGSGYPDALRGDGIPLLAQIVGVVDVYEAVTSKRPYQSVYAPSDAIALLRRGVSAGQYRGDIVDAFAATLSGRGVEELAAS